MGRRRTCLEPSQPPGHGCTCASRAPQQLFQQTKSLRTSTDDARGTSASALHRRNARQWVLHPHQRLPDDDACETAPSRLTSSPPSKRQPKTCARAPTCCGTSIRHRRFGAFRLLTYRDHQVSQQPPFANPKVPPIVQSRNRVQNRMPFGSVSATRGDEVRQDVVDVDESAARSDVKRTRRGAGRHRKGAWQILPKGRSDASTVLRPRSEGEAFRFQHRRLDVRWCVDPTNLGKWPRSDP